MVNDAPPSNANCRMKLISVDGQARLCLFAVQPIEAGEELCYDYGDKEDNLWWRNEHKVKHVLFFRIISYSMVLFGNVLHIPLWHSD